MWVMETGKHGYRLLEVIPTAVERIAVDEAPQTPGCRAKD